MKRLLAAALAAALLWTPPAGAQQQAALETWEPASIRAGPWAGDIAKLTGAYQAGDWVLLERSLRRFRPAFAERYGEASPAYAETLMLEGLMLYETDRAEASLPLIAESARRYEEALHEHRDVAIALHTYGDVLLNTRGDAALAEIADAYSRAYAIRAQVLAQDAVETVAVGTALTSTLLRRYALEHDRALLARAEALAREVLERSNASHGFDYVKALTTCADVLIARGDYAGAEPLLRRAADSMAYVAPDRIADAAVRIYPPLIDALERQGKIGEAAAMRAVYEAPIASGGGI